MKIDVDKEEKLETYQVDGFDGKKAFESNFAPKTLNFGPNVDTFEQI